MSNFRIVKPEKFFNLYEDGYGKIFKEMEKHPYILL